MGNIGHITVSHVLWFIPDRYAGVLKDTCRASFSCVLVSRRTLKTPGLSISRIFTEEGPPVFLRLSHSEVNPAPAGRIVQTAAPPQYLYSGRLSSRQVFRS